MSSKKITIICFVATILIALFGGISVYALTVNNNPFEKGPKGAAPDKDIKTSIAKVDSITSNNIVLLLGEDSDSKDKDKKYTTDDFKNSGKTVTLTFDDENDISGITKDEIVVVRYNKDNELESIKKVQENTSKEKTDNENKVIGKVEKIEGDQLTIIPGELKRSNNSKNFNPSGESQTYTVKDPDDLEDISVNDIVKIEIEDNKVTDIDLAGEDSGKGASMDSNQSNPSNQNSDKANFSSNI